MERTSTRGFGKVLMFSDLIPEIQPFAQALVDAAGAAGLLPRVTSTRRSHALQKRLYDRFLAGASQYPALPPGRSAHEYGYAFDMVVSPMEALEDVGYTWEQWGGIWGGHARDPIHFEFPGFVSPGDVEYIGGSERVASIANIGASFLPGITGVLASFSELLTGERVFEPGKSPCPWYNPFCDQ